MLVPKNLKSEWDVFNANFAKLSQIIIAAVIHSASKHSLLLDRKHCSVFLYHMTQDLVIFFQQLLVLVSRIDPILKIWQVFSQQQAS